jgi:elongator complex protein 3
MGAQSLDEEVLKKNNRGCSIEDISRATRLMKDAGFKICYHMMLNMPFSNQEKDYEQFIKLFKDENYQPDYLKIYPCVVAQNRALEKLVESGKYKLYNNEELINLLKKIKQQVPSYVRIIRIYRDIPADEIKYGSMMSNIREMLLSAKCRCIRCREIKDQKIQSAKLHRIDYKASGGKEVFLSIEDTKQDKLIALLRLRVSSSCFIKELQGCALIRELHSYGNQLGLGRKDKTSSQHKGYGKQLILEAEKIAKVEFGLKKIAVIAGVGTREYYYKLGYRLCGERGYMIKKLG